MTDQAGAAVIAELERAELAAREARLAAESEAEGIGQEAMARVRAIEAGVDLRIATALAECRRAHLERAAAEVAAIDAELDGLERRGRSSSLLAGAPTAAFEEAVATVVAAVLGETGGA